MSGALTALVEGTLEAVADVAEHSGGVLGEAEAQTLSLQITALAGTVPALAAAAEEDPFLALAGVAVGIAAAVAAAPAAVDATAALLVGLGVSEAESLVVSAAAQAVSSLIISAGVEGWISDVAAIAPGVGQIVQTVANDASGWYSGSIPVTDVALPTDLNANWGQTSGPETYLDYAATGTQLGSVTLNTDDTTSMLSDTGAAATISGPTNYTQSFGTDGSIIISVGGTGDIVNATSAVINLNLDSNITIGSGTGDVVNNNVAGNFVDLDANTQATVAGNGGDVFMNGAGASVTTTGTNATVVMNDASDYASIGASDTVWEEGTQDNVLATGTGAGAVLAGTSDYATLNAGGVANITGGNGTVWANGLDSSVYATGTDAVAVLNGASAYASIGASDTAWEEGAQDNVATSGTGGDAVLAGTSDYATLNAGGVANITGSNGTVWANGLELQRVCDGHRRRSGAQRRFGLRLDRRVGHRVGKR